MMQSLTAYQVPAKSFGVARARYARGNNGLSPMAGELAEFNAVLSPREDSHPSMLRPMSPRRLPVSTGPLHIGLNFISTTDAKFG